MKAFLFVLLSMVLFTSAPAAQVPANQKIQIEPQDGSRDSVEWSDVYPDIVVRMDSVINVKRHFDENPETGIRVASKIGKLQIQDLYPMAMSHYTNSPEWLLVETGNETVSFDAELDKPIMNKYYSFTNLNPAAEIKLVELNLIHLDGKVTEIVILSYKKDKTSHTGFKAHNRKVLVLR